MVERDIKHFGEIRTKARAYFCYLFSKNLPNRLPSITKEAVLKRLLKIQGDLKASEGVYIIDEKGVQVTPTICQSKNNNEDIGQILSSRAYYYRAMNEKRCTITDPYPSLITNELTVTASQPIFDEHGDIKYVACIDVQLDEVLRITHPLALNKISGKFFKWVYGAFSLVLAMVSLLLFLKGVQLFISSGIDFRNLGIKHIFEATILLTLSLAIFDLVKTLFEEEVLGNEGGHNVFEMHKTMVRFIGSIIIALSIEALMLVFKFAITEPDKIINAIYIIMGVVGLLFGLAVYIKLTRENYR